MKRYHIPFPQRGQHGRAPRIQSRTLGLRDFVNVAYKSDGKDGEDGEPDAAKKALLDEIQQRVKTEIEARKYQDATAVQSIVTRALEGLPLDVLKTYKEDSEKVNTTIRNIAGELEKIKNVRLGDTPANHDLMKRAVEAIVKAGEKGEPAQLELLMRNKGVGGQRELVINVRAAATMTTANTVDENSYPEEMIESVNLIDEVVKKRRGEQFIFQIADRTTVDELEQYTSWLEEGNEQGAFAIVSEGAVKPLVSTSLVRNFAQAKKVAGKMVITEEFAKFRKKIWSAVQSLLRDKLIRDYAALLVIDLQAEAAQYVGTSLDGTFDNPTDYDAIGAVAAQEETLNFVPDLLIIHPQDKWRLALQKDGNDRYYMMIPMMGPDGVTRMMGFRVLTSTYQTIGSFTLGESGLFKIEDEAITIRIGYGIDVTTGTVSATTVVTAVSSDLDNNRLRMIVETWFKDWIPSNHLGSFVTDTFANVKTALQAP